MTMFSKHEVINNLREEKEKLEDKLKAIENWYNAQLGNEVDPQDIRELREILEGEK